MVTCCSLPRVSVKRRSAYLSSLSLINLITSAGFIVRNPLGRGLSLGLNAFAVPVAESFRINELVESALHGRTFLVRAARFCSISGRNCAQLESPALR